MPDPKVFLSYRREDSAGYAGRLFDHLSARFPNRVFMDVDGIAAGADFIGELEKSIKSSDVLVALIGRHWLAADSAARRRIDDPGDFVRLELETALTNGVRIIPTLVGGATIPAIAELPASLQALTRRQAVELGDTTFSRDVQFLVQQLKEISSLAAAERRERAAAEKHRRKEDELIRRRQQREARLAAQAHAPGRQFAFFGAPVRWWRTAVVRYPILGRPIAVAAVLSAAVVFSVLSSFTYLYTKYSRIVDATLRDGALPRVTRVYSLPETLRVGAPASPDMIASTLKWRGYTQDQRNSEGYFKVGPDTIEIYPGPESYFRRDAVVLKFSEGRIAHAVSLSDNAELHEYLIEPLAFTDLTRGKRRLTRFEDIPAVLVHAVISAEDKRFFQHAGFDPSRMFARFGRGGTSGGSLTTALVRMLWPPEKPNVREVSRDAVITMQLEQKLSKEQIFELYANQVYLGGSGNFIRGFAEAAEYCFGKLLADVNLPEAALLAGMVSRPNYYFPFRWPDRARERRNVVLGLMRENGFITDKMYAAAIEAPLVLAKRDNDFIAAPHFADIVSDELHSRFQDVDFLHSSYRVYTSLDIGLQQAAVEAVRTALPQCDALITSDPRWRSYPPADVALVALEPKTGQVRALVGGRNYGVIHGQPSNRSIEKRPPGSAFLPFDFAAAISAAPGIFTLHSRMDDSSRAFVWNNRRIAPPEFFTRHFGTVTLGDAIARSLYAPALSAAEKAGYEAVAALVRKCGLYEAAKPSPDLVMGYEPTTPLAVAAAYTVFANQGTWVKPVFVLSVRDDNGRLVYEHKSEQRVALDAGTTSLISKALQSVARSAAVASAQDKNLAAPPAVVTGRSSDAWCVGFTPQLLAVVWIGYPDGREFPLDGAASALPVWTAFMTRASRLQADKQSFFERLKSIFP